MHCIQRSTADFELFLHYFIQDMCSYESSMHIYIGNLVPGYFIDNRYLITVMRQKLRYFCTYRRCGGIKRLASVWVLQ